MGMERFNKLLEELKSDEVRRMTIAEMKDENRESNDKWVRLSDMQKLFEKFCKLDSEFSAKGFGHIGCEPVAIAVVPVSTDSGSMPDAFVKVHAEGALRIKGLSYKGSVIYLDGPGGNRPYISSANKDVTQETIDNMKSRSHDGLCDCCGTSRKRKDFYYFEADKDVTIENRTYKKGELYQVGSNCVDKFVGTQAFKLISQFSNFEDGLDRQNTATQYANVGRMAAYIEAVAKSHIDDIYHETAGKYRSSKNVKAGECPEFVSSNRYIRTKKEGYGREGSIAKMAKAIYVYMENDGEIDASFFGNNDSELRRAKIEQFKYLMSRFNKSFNQKSIDEATNRLNKELNAFAKNYESDYTGNEVVRKLENENVKLFDADSLIHLDNVQYVVDILDANQISKENEKQKTLSLNDLKKTKTVRGKEIYPYEHASSDRYLYHEYVNKDLLDKYAPKVSVDKKGNISVSGWVPYYDNRDKTVHRRKANLLLNNLDNSDNKQVCMFENMQGMSEFFNGGASKANIMINGKSRDKYVQMQSRQSDKGYQFFYYSATNDVYLVLNNKDTAKGRFALMDNFVHLTDANIKDYVSQVSSSCELTEEIVNRIGKAMSAAQLVMNEGKKKEPRKLPDGTVLETPVTYDVSLGNGLTATSKRDNRELPYVDSSNSDSKKAPKLGED